MITMPIIIIIMFMIAMATSTIIITTTMNILKARLGGRDAS